MVPIAFSLLSADALHGLAAALPADKTKKASELVELLTTKGLLEPNGLLTDKKTLPLSRDELSPEGQELFDIFNAELDRSLREYINASTLKDQFTEEQASSIYRLGRFVVRMNEQFIDCELGAPGCVRVQ